MNIKITLATLDYSVVKNLDGNFCVKYSHCNLKQVTVRHISSIGSITACSSLFLQLSQILTVRLSRFSQDLFDDGGSQHTTAESTKGIFS